MSVWLANAQNLTRGEMDSVTAGARDINGISEQFLKQLVLLGKISCVRQEMYNKEPTTIKPGALVN